MFRGMKRHSVSRSWFGKCRYFGELRYEKVSRYRQVVVFGDEDSRAPLCDGENVVYNITNYCTFLNCQ